MGTASTHRVEAIGRRHAGRRFKEQASLRLNAMLTQGKRSGQGGRSLSGPNCSSHAALPSWKPFCRPQRTGRRSIWPARRPTVSLGGGPRSGSWSPSTRVMLPCSPRTCRCSASISATRSGCASGFGAVVSSGGRTT